MLKHWRTSLCGVACFVLASPIIIENINNRAYNFHRIFETMHFWGLPLGLVCLGIGLLHAADHKNLPPK